MNHSALMSGFTESQSTKHTFPREKRKLATHCILNGNICINNVYRLFFLWIKKWNNYSIYMISTLQLSWKNNYTWHHTHYMWHHSHCICPATPGASIDHNSLGSYPTWHTYDIIHTLHDITITLYDITPQYLWHHSHCIHDIIYPT